MTRSIVLKVFTSLPGQEFLFCSGDLFGMAEPLPSEQFATMASHLVDVRAIASKGILLI